MRTRISWAGVMLAALLAAAPAAAQEDANYFPPTPQYPLPLYHDRPDKGGFFLFGEFLFMRQTNPIAHQLIAVRGLQDIDGSITADLNGIVIVPTPTGTTGSQAFILPGIRMPGTFLGSSQPALYADDLGPATYQPGFKLGAGWRFENGFVLETSWSHLMDAKYSANAGLIPFDRNPGFFLENTFLFSPVYNFPNEYAGPQFKVALGNPNAAFGIWNGATNMQIRFTQRFDQWEIGGRIPMYQSADYRCYGLGGAQLDWVWERFTWRTVGQDFLGNATPEDVAIYSNTVSNRFYGPYIGCGNELRLGDTPAGTFSVSLDVQAALLIDVVKERAKYERGDFATAAQRARTEFTVAPELQANVNLWWYPIEGVELRFGYDVMAFFNTVAGQNPVSFNYGGLDPPWNKNVYRFFDGFNAGIGLIF